MPVATLPATTDTAGGLAPVAARSVTPPLLRLCEPWPTVDGDERPGERTTAVALDRGHPIALWLVSGNFDRLAPITLRAGANDDPRGVLRRAVDRPVGCRFDPVVCVDNSGRLIGVVPVEELARHVALG
ncbi:MAG: hypothetical protein ACFCVF_11880 [Kineosporiaceae bacterium]